MEEVAVVRELESVPDAIFDAETDKLIEPAPFVIVTELSEEVRFATTRPPLYVLPIKSCPFV